MWEGGVDRDDSGESLSRKAQQWFEELSHLRARLGIPRCVRTGTGVRCISLHTFVDAPQEAYGAAAYSRHLYEDGTVTCCQKSCLQNQKSRHFKGSTFGSSLWS